MICSRIFTLRIGDQLLDVPLQVDAPVDRGSHWTCAFAIGWPGGAMRKEAAGFDSAQALLLAFEMAGALIHASAFHRDGVLWWEKPGGGYGLPVPKGMRDMLVGDDWG